MLWGDFWLEMVDNCVMQDEDTGHWFVDPEFYVHAHAVGLSPLAVTDEQVNWPMVKDALELEVKRRNLRQDKVKSLMDVLYMLLSEAQNGPLTDMSNGLVEEMLAFMKEKEKIEVQKEALEQYNKASIAQKQLPKAMTFAKKK